MYNKNCFFYSVLFCFTCLRSASLAQSINEVRQVGSSLDVFALKFLATTCQQAGDSINIALSPYNIWSLLVYISEGAQENTAIELQNTLGIPPNQEREWFRRAYQELDHYLTKRNDTGVVLDSTNSMFISADQHLKANFLNITRTIYNADLTAVNFQETTDAVNTINNHINTASRGRIPTFVREDDIRNSKAFMTSVLFFKGFWTTAFNQTLTSKEVFYDDEGTQKGQVDMMYNEGLFPFSLIYDDKAIAVELPYKGDRMAMIVILPKRKVPLQSILNKMAEGSFWEIVNILDRSIEEFGDEPVKVYLPKFRIASDLNLNPVLRQMGINDIFNESKANFSEMFIDNNLYISRIIQRAEIKVDEEGTEASAASGASFQYRSPPPKFLANKPFAFVIYNKETRGIVFAGKVSDPTSSTN